MSYTTCLHASAGKLAPSRHRSDGGVTLLSVTNPLANPKGKEHFVEFPRIIRNSSWKWHMSPRFLRDGTSNHLTLKAHGACIQESGGMIANKEAVANGHLSTCQSPSPGLSTGRRAKMQVPQLSLRLSLHILEAAAWRCTSNQHALRC